MHRSRDIRRQVKAVSMGRKWCCCARSPEDATVSLIDPHLSFRYARAKFCKDQTFRLGDPLLHNDAHGRIHTRTPSGHSILWQYRVVDLKIT